MMYPYMKLADGTEVVHSNILDKDGVKSVEVHFERPTDEGFDTARCVLPTYQWLKKEGYTSDEIEFFEIFLKNNAHLFYN